jgi:chemotaxis protein MotB
MVPAIPYEVALLESIKTTLAKDFGANIISNEKGLEINFDGVSFFNSGRTQLIPEGAQTIQKIIQKLAPNKEQIHVTVQGHTDPTKTNAKMNFQDNWELSVLRATSVLKLFIKNGFSQKMLSAEGFADTRSEQINGKLSKEELARMRRVTLRIEPVKVRQ